MDGRRSRSVVDGQRRRRYSVRRELVEELEPPDPDRLEAADWGRRGHLLPFQLAVLRFVRHAVLAALKAGGSQAQQG